MYFKCQLMTFLRENMYVSMLILYKTFKTAMLAKTSIIHFLKGIF